MAVLPYLPKNTLLDIEIKINGDNVGLGALMSEATIQYEFNKVPFAKFTFISSSLLNDKDNKSPLHSLKQDSSKDKTIELVVKIDTKPTTLFKGYVKSVENKGDDTQSIVKIECKDLAHKLTLPYELDKKIQEESFETKMNHFTGLYKIDVDSSLKSQSWSSTVTSYKNNPWDYIISFLDAIGMMVNVRNNTLSATNILKEDVEEKYLAENGINLFSFSAKYDDSKLYSSVSLHSWDSEKQEEKKISEKNTSSTTSATSQDVVVKTSEIRLPDNMQATVAKTILKKSQLAVRYGKLTTFGNATAKLGDYLICKNANEKIDNQKLLISQELHTIENGCWKTEYTFGIEQQASFAEAKSTSNDVAHAVTGQSTSIAGLQIAIVTNIDEDPNKEFRIKVKIPAIDANSDGVWARLASNFASDKYGSFFIPDIGDEVIIGCLGNNADTPIVLGCLYSKKHTSPQEIKKENYIKGIYTKEGTKIEIDEEKKSIEISTKKGNTVKLSEDSKGIEITDENMNKIVMDDSGITIESCKDVKIKAQNEVSIEGINLKAKATASMELKGGIVKIN